SRRCSVLSPQPSVLSPQSSVLSPQSSVLNPQSSPQPSVPSPHLLSSWSARYFDGGNRRRKSPVLSQQEHRDSDGYQHYCDIGASKARYAKAQKIRPQKHDPGRQHITASHEEGVDRLLGVVLLLAGRGQPHHLLSSVHNRIVGAVLRDLD